MSVTIRDCLNLPSLQLATVVAGQNGLDKTVDSISVLEWIDLDNTKRHYFFSNEIVITSFYALQDDVDAQVRTIEYLHKSGEIGVVLYYVGLVLKKLDTRVIGMADRLDFPIILMPVNQDALRYSEVIMDVAGLIHQDLLQETDLVKYIMERLVNVPQQNRNFTTLLRIVSDRLKVSIVFSNENYTDCIFCPWPRLNETLYTKVISALTDNVPLNNGIEVKRIIELYNVKWPVAKMVFIGSASLPENPKLFEQAVQIVQLTSKLWGLNIKKDLPYELFYAIIHNESIRVKQIAKVIKYDIEQINHLIVIMTKRANSKTINQLYRSVRDVIRLPQNSYILTALEDRIILLTHAHNVNDCIHSLIHHIEYDKRIMLFYAANLLSVEDVHAVYHDFYKYSKLMPMAFKKTQAYTVSQLKLVTDYSMTTSESLDALQPLLYFLRRNTAVADTLACYFLDAKQSSALVADYLLIHQNTVKYRLDKAMRLMNIDLHASADIVWLIKALIHLRLE